MTIKGRYPLSNGLSRSFIIKMEGAAVYFPLWIVLYQTPREELEFGTRLL